MSTHQEENSPISAVLRFLRGFSKKSKSRELLSTSDSDSYYDEDPLVPEESLSVFYRERAMGWARLHSTLRGVVHSHPNRCAVVRTDSVARPYGDGCSLKPTFLHVGLDQNDNPCLYSFDCLPGMTPETSVPGADYISTYVAMKMKSGYWLEVVDGRMQGIDYPLSYRYVESGDKLSFRKLLKYLGS